MNFILIKNLVNSRIEINLDEVSLLGVADDLIKTFSGGMKRRLSLAIAFLGNPKIVFLDEPTTGMDPRNRRNIWEMILKLKNDKAIILTTHSMEEADALSDKVIVLVEGKLKCIGNPLYLKNNFGYGYRLNLIVEPENSQISKEIILKLIPNSKCIDNSGGSLIFGIPYKFIKEIDTFFRIIEKKISDNHKFYSLGIELVKMIKDWGISNTTLDDVFMKLNVKSLKNSNFNKFSSIMSENTDNS